MDLKAIIQTALKADATLTSILTGGVWSSNDKIKSVPIIGLTPKQIVTFDDVGRVKPTLYFRIETINPTTYSQNEAFICYVTFFVFNVPSSFNEDLLRVLVSLTGQQQIFDVKLATVQPEQFSEELNCLFQFYRFQFIYSNGVINE